MRRKFHLGHIRSWRDCSVKSCSSIHSIVFECRSTVPPFHRSPRSFEPCPVAFPVSGADIGRIFHRKAMIVMKKCRSCQKRRPEKSMSIPSCFTEQPFAQGVPSSAMGFGWRINPRAPSLPMREFNPISMRQWLPAATTTLLKKGGCEALRQNGQPSLRRSPRTGSYHRRHESFRHRGRSRRRYVLPQNERRHSFRPCPWLQG